MPGWRTHLWIILYRGLPYVANYNGSAALFAVVNMEIIAIAIMADLILPILTQQPVNQLGGIDMLGL